MEGLNRSMQPMRTCKGLQPSIIGRTDLDRLAPQCRATSPTWFDDQWKVGKLTLPRLAASRGVFDVKYLTTHSTGTKDTEHRTQETTWKKSLSPRQLAFPVLLDLKLVRSIQQGLHASSLKDLFRPLRRLCVP